MPSFVDGLLDAAADATATAAQELTVLLQRHAVRTGIDADDAAYLRILQVGDELIPGFAPDTPDEVTGRLIDAETGGLATTPTAFIRRFDRRYRDVAAKLIEGKLNQSLTAVL